MDHIRLIPPTNHFANDIWRFRQEIIDSTDADKFAGCSGLEDCTSAEEWIESIRVKSNGATCPEGRVPSNVYIAVRQHDQKIVGIIDLRHHIDHPILGTWGGHIGYYVRPDERRKGYGKEMLRQNLLNAKALGLSKVLVTCHEGNLGSERTILANGGVYERSIEVDGTLIKRYWLSTDRK